MSQPRKGNPPQPGESQEFDSVPTGPISSILLQGRIVTNELVDTRLLALSLRLCAELEPQEAQKEALEALAALLPNCTASILPRSDWSRKTEPSSSRPNSIVTECGALLAQEEYVWQLEAPCRASPLSLRITVETPECAADVLSIGGKVTTLLSTFLRRKASNPEQEARRDKYEELFLRAVQAEKLAGYGRVVAGVLHDLNNPLTAIVAYSDCLGRTLPAQNVSHADLLRLSRIREAAERAHEYTRSLVEYARPSGTKATRVDLSKVISNALMFCEHEFALVGLQAEVKLDHLSRPVRGIAGQLTQLFVNLFTNAAHAARENDARLTVEGELDGDPHCAKIRVTDNGTGIQESDLAYIFDPFFTTKCDGRGNGLGLAIVRDIVDGHGGHIDVSSQVGHGTTFSICLPVVSEDED